jgi:hypothetical protein
MAADVSSAGDVTINPDATLLVMTTEILRSMLYRGSELVREVLQLMNHRSFWHWIIHLPSTNSAGLVNCTRT